MHNILALSKAEMQNMVQCNPQSPHAREHNQYANNRRVKSFPNLQNTNPYYDYFHIHEKVKFRSKYLILCQYFLANPFQSRTMIRTEGLWSHFKHAITGETNMPVLNVNWLLTSHKRFSIALRLTALARYVALKPFDQSVKLKNHFHPHYWSRKRFCDIQNTYNYFIMSAWLIYFLQRI